MIVSPEGFCEDISKLLGCRDETRSKDKALHAITQLISMAKDVFGFFKSNGISRKFKSRLVINEQRGRSSDPKT